MREDFLDECVSILSRTPATLNALLRDIPEACTSATEGPQTWSAYDVVGHLIHGEIADWMPRAEIILEHGTNIPFEPYDREAQFRDSAGKRLPQMLDEFSALRAANLTRLLNLNLQAKDLALEGMHPELGRVSLRQLLATWTAHDLSHVIQVSRVMAKRIRCDVGPWAAYLSVLK